MFLSFLKNKNNVSARRLVLLEMNMGFLVDA